MSYSVPQHNTIQHNTRPAMSNVRLRNEPESLPTAYEIMCVASPCFVPVAFCQKASQGGRAHVPFFAEKEAYIACTHS
jgi:hypothetical protein